MQPTLWQSAYLAIDVKCFGRRYWSQAIARNPDHGTRLSNSVRGEETPRFRMDAHHETIVMVSWPVSMVCSELTSKRIYELRDLPRRELRGQRRQPARDHGDPQLPVLRGISAHRRDLVRPGQRDRGGPARLRPRAGGPRGGNRDLVGLVRSQRVNL